MEKARRRAWSSIRSNWQIRPGSTEAYLAAILFVVVASLVRWGLGRLGLLNAEGLPYSTYYPAVLFGTVVGGSRAGAVAAILGGIIGWWDFTPQHLAFPPLTFGHFWLYIFASLLIVWGADHGRRLTDQSRRFAKHLQDEEN